MRLAVRLAVIAALSVVLLGIGAMAAGQISEEQAKKIFESKGCNACHNGAVAPTFEKTVEKIKEWAKKYSSLDEAVSKEYTYAGGAKSYDEMMQQMKRFTPSISDQDFKLLYDFFKQVFEEAKGGTATAAETTTTTTQTAQTQTATQTPAETATKTEAATATPASPTQTQTPTVPPTTPISPYGEETEKHISTTVLVGIAVLVAVVVAAIFIYYRRR